MDTPEALRQRGSRHHRRPGPRACSSNGPRQRPPGARPAVSLSLGDHRGRPAPRGSRGNRPRHPARDLTGVYKNMVRGVIVGLPAARLSAAIERDRRRPQPSRWADERGVAELASDAYAHESSTRPAIRMHRRSAITTGSESSKRLTTTDIAIFGSVCNLRGCRRCTSKKRKKARPLARHALPLLRCTTTCALKRTYLLRAAPIFDSPKGTKRCSNKRGGFFSWDIQGHRTGYRRL